VELPLQFREGLLWLTVRAEGCEEPLNFLLDSGASVSVLDVHRARQLGLKLGAETSVAGVRTMLTGYWPVRLSASLGEIQLPRQVLALDLNLLSSACSRRVDGLVGADFFRNRIVRIDYAAQTLRLLDAPPREKGQQSIRLRSRQELAIRVSVDRSRAQWVRVDTGCASALQWVTARTPSGGTSTRPAVGLAALDIPQTVAAVLARFGSVTFHAQARQLILGPMAD
jgi:hypothetical protein